MHVYYRQLLLVVFILASSSLNAQPKRLFDYNEGLSNSLINQVYQDHLGFIWVATEDGLNRFDGLRFTTYSKDNHSQNSLNGNFVTALCEDNENKLWVGQINGLQVYNIEDDSFDEVEIYVENKRIYPYVSSIIKSKNNDIWISTSAYGLIRIDHNVGRPRYSTRLNKQLCSFYLETIYEDRDGILWIGSDSEGLNSYNPGTDEIETYTETSKAPFRIPSNDISSICEDAQGNIYIGSIKGGLIRLDKNTHKIEPVLSANPLERNLPVKSLLFDSKNRLWVGTDGLGLKLLNTKTGLLESHLPGSSPFDYSKSKIHSIIEDNGGNLWVGVFQKGLYLFPEIPEMFNHYGYRAFGENSIGSNCITSIDGNLKELWIGTDGDGIYHLNRESQKIKHLLLKNEKNIVEGNNVLSLYNTPNDILWIGTYFNGLLKYNKHNGKLKVYKNKVNDPYSLVNDKITVIQPGNNGQLWLGDTGGWCLLY